MVVVVVIIERLIIYGLCACVRPFRLWVTDARMARRHTDPQTERTHAWHAGTFRAGRVFISKIPVMHAPDRSNKQTITTNSTDNHTNNIKTTKNNKDTTIIGNIKQNNIPPPDHLLRAEVRSVRGGGAPSRAGPDKYNMI